MSSSPFPRWKTQGDAFDRIFGEAVTTTDTSALLRSREQQLSVVDAVIDDYRRLSVRLGPEDRERIDRHLSALREVETAIEGLDVTTSCEVPTREDASTGDIPAAGAIHLEMMVRAMACNLTPVTVMQWGTGQSGINHRFIGVDRAHHGLSHEDHGDSRVLDELTAVNQWYSEQLATLLDKMSAIVEGDGQTLLDHSVVLWCNELGRGDTHDRRNIPYVLAGKAGGALRTGRYVRYDQAPHGNLFVSILNALGIPDTSFGDPDFSDGPLTGLG